MRLLKSNSIELGIRATNLSRLYYYQEFNKEIDIILDEIRYKQYNEENITTELYKILWCMVKAENFYLKKSTPCYPQWIQSYQHFNINDCAIDLFEEIKQGFIVTKTYSKVNNSVNNYEENHTECLGQRIFIVAKKIGLSMNDLNKFTTQQLIDIFYFYGREKMYTKGMKK